MSHPSKDSLIRFDSIDYSVFPSRVPRAVVCKIAFDVRKVVVCVNIRTVASFVHWILDSTNRSFPRWSRLHVPSIILLSRIFNVATQWERHRCRDLSLPPVSLLSLGDPESTGNMHSNNIHSALRARTDEQFQNGTDDLSIEIVIDKLPRDRAVGSNAPMIAVGKRETLMDTANE